MYVDTILNLIRIAGDYVSEEVWYRYTDRHQPGRRRAMPPRSVRGAPALPCFPASSGPASTSRRLSATSPDFHVAAPGEVLFGRTQAAWSKLPR